MNPLRVTLIGTAHPFRGGLAAFNERLAHEFQAQGHRVSIETFTLQYPALLFPGKSQYATWEKPASLTIRRSVSSVNPLSWFTAARKVRREGSDLVVIKYWLPFMAPCLGTLARLLRRGRRTVVLAIADNIVPHEKRAGDTLLTRWFMGGIDGMVTMSESVTADARRFRETLPLRFCPHPLFDDFGKTIPREEALARLGLDPRPRYLLFFGFIRDYKGLDWLLRAFADPLLEKLPLRLLVAGEFYADPKPYLSLLEELRLGDRVVLHTDFIANDRVNHYFCAADLVVQPYKHATQSGVTQIAYYFDRPMVVTRVGGLAEMIPHGRAGYVVDPSPGAIAAAIADFFEKGRLEELSQNVAREKKKYEWARMVKALLELYQEIKQPC